MEWNTASFLELYWNNLKKLLKKVYENSHILLGNWLKLRQVIDVYFLLHTLNNFVKIWIKKRNLVNVLETLCDKHCWWCDQASSLGLYGVCEVFFSLVIWIISAYSAGWEFSPISVNVRKLISVSRLNKKQYFKFHCKSRLKWSRRRATSRLLRSRVIGLCFSH